ncbi:MAG: integrase arm-type DNA-binding domain-containing protein, partial [Pseudomonadota bacterium]
MASGGQLPANVQVVGKVIRARELNNGKEVEYRIQGVPGLCLRINPKASAKWSLKYHIYEGGKRKAKRFPLGDASDKNMGKAIDRAVKLMSQIKTEGLDPVEIKRSVEQAPKPDVVTFGDVFEMWLERWAKLNLRSWQHDETNYKNHLKKTLGQKSVSEIVRADVIAMRDTILQNSGPVQSNRMLALFNRVMHWAVEEDYVQANPGSKLRKVGQEKPKDRVLA